MRSIGSVLARTPELSRRRDKRQYRGGASFVGDPTRISTPLNRDERGRLVRQAEQIELRSKGKGQRNGILGQTGLAVLRVLVFKFSNRLSGLCIPSYTSIMEATGFCRQTVAKAIRALEACGLVKAVRRLVRRMIDGVVRAVQGSNVYSFRLGGTVQLQFSRQRENLPRSFPKPRAFLDLLVGMRGSKSTC
jgi:hypothetical protein